MCQKLFLKPQQHASSFIWHDAMNELTVSTLAIAHCTKCKTFDFKFTLAEVHHMCHEKAPIYSKTETDPDSRQARDPLYCTGGVHMWTRSHVQ